MTSDASRKLPKRMGVTLLMTCNTGRCPAISSEAECWRRGLRNQGQYPALPRLMRGIRDWYEASGMTQSEAAKVLHMSRPELSNLLNGHIYLFTIDRLVNALSAAG